MDPQDGAPDGFRRLDRERWAELGGTLPVDGAVAVPGPHGELPHPLDPAVVALVRYVAMRGRQAVQLRAAESAFLRAEDPAAPFVVGVVGPVAVGKSTLARTLQVLLRAGSGATSGAEVVSTDSFLLPNDELARRGLVERKGFPESYDWDALTRFLLDVRHGRAGVSVRVYSHGRYDVRPAAGQEVGPPGGLVVEGLTLLQVPPTPGFLEPADLVDLAVYVHADEARVRRWFVERFMRLRSGAGEGGDSFFRMFAALSDEEALRAADAVWESVNLPNIRDHVAPTRVRADVVVVKGDDHAISEVHLRVP